MELQVIGTGSSGNCYILRAGGENGQALMLDAGLPINQIIKAAQWWRSLVGCLITHEHLDHAKSAIEIAKYGIPTYATAGTIKAIAGDCDLTQLNRAESARDFLVGDFHVMPFETQHDAAEPCGWLIRYIPTGETAVYATDTYYLRYTFPGVDYWIIECNYVNEIVDMQHEEGTLTYKLRSRLNKSHMSLRRLCDVFEANDLSETRAIVLVHLSDERSDEFLMVSTIREKTGIDNVWAAESGQTYKLNLIPF